MEVCRSKGKGTTYIYIVAISSTTCHQASADRLASPCSVCVCGTSLPCTMTQPRHPAAAPCISPPCKTDGRVCVGRMARRVLVEGLQLNCEVAGEGAKVALCLPGALGSAKSDFGPQLSSLAGEDLTLVGWDPPGYGDSRPPPRKFSNDYLRRDAVLAAKMMETLGYDKYALLGWSDGGISALMLAAAFPGQVSELVVWGANAFVTEEDVNLTKSIRDINKWSPKMRAPLEAMYGEEYLRATWEDCVDTFVKILEEENGDLCRDDLAKISCPTLIIHGRKDPIVPWHHAEYLRDNIEGAELVFMEEGKHNIHLRYPQEFNRLVKEFLHGK